MEEQREQHAKEMAEMQAKLDAMAKQVAVGSDASAEELQDVQVEEPKAKPKRKSPAKKAEKVVEKAQQEDDFDIDY